MGSRHRPLFGRWSPRQRADGYRRPLSATSDSRLAEFLRRVEVSGDDAAPAAVVVGTGEVSEVQESIAPQFAATVRELGHVEPAGGPDGDLRRVRLTPAGRDRLAEYDRTAPTLHPRFSS
ncbi:hypothetical protein [Pseudonocardia alni]|uniref:hypothetical protein n=1 Tax=Pseudonocardia alni TaxID=33907 RepID=UPI00280A7540|nr:hypothetical protein [Pseudonocardia alni]